MMTRTLALCVASAALLAFAPACGSDDGGGSGGSAGSTGGAAGSNTGGMAGGNTGGMAGGNTGGMAGGNTGGMAGMAGSNTGGMAGMAGSGGTAGMAGSGGMAGAAGAAGSGGAAGGAAFWPANYASYDANCTPTKNHNHNSQLTQNCMNCHTGNGGTPKFTFGGRVYQTGGSTGAAKVEIGVKDGTTFYYACSDNQGKFFYESNTATVNWATAEIHMRNANGETNMKNAAPNGGCNASNCHGNTMKLIEP
ncbi:MAG: hypothetical protein KC776_35090 [Myxococcales bacterium]|nr:hypothetical protein [Myxococcales bacterium]MCB9578802.1 hypothetical protein [Polyangiaceae bacterium]